MIRYPDHQVIEIAYSLGFNSASAFTRAFRRRYDLAPQDHRLMAAQRMGNARNVAGRIDQ